MFWEGKCCIAQKPTILSNYCGNLKSLDILRSILDGQW